MNEDQFFNDAIVVEIGDCKDSLYQSCKYVLSKTKDFIFYSIHLHHIYTYLQIINYNFIMRISSLIGTQNFIVFYIVYIILQYKYKK